MTPIPEALDRGKAVTVRPFEQPEYEVFRDYTLRADISSCVCIHVGDQTVYIERNDNDGLIIDSWDNNLGKRVY